MKLLNTIKEHLPMEDLQTLFSYVQNKIGSKKIKIEDPNILEAEKVMKRIHYLLSEKSNIDLGKQEVYKRDIKSKDGDIKNYTYRVDFTDPEQISRLRTVLLELADLSSPDSSKAKKESISGYLDYIAQASS